MFKCVCERNKNTNGICESRKVFEEGYGIWDTVTIKLDDVWQVDPLERHIRANKDI